MAVAFEDPGKSYESLSYFVSRLAKPSGAMQALACFDRARRVCGTGDRPPTPLEMFACGYRVAKIEASEFFQIIESSRDGRKPLKIKCEKNGDDFREDGHLNLENGRHYAALISRFAIEIDEHEYGF